MVAEARRLTKKPQSDERARPASMPDPPARMPDEKRSFESGSPSPVPGAQPNENSQKPCSALRRSFDAPLHVVAKLYRRNVRLPSVATALNRDVAGRDDDVDQRGLPACVAERHITISDRDAGDDVARRWSV